MQLKTLLITAILPFGLMANPTPDPEADVTEVGGPLDPRRAIVRPQHCRIVGGSRTVNCRSRARTSSSIKHRLTRGVTYDFWCVQKGECVTINGFQNCGWHYSKQLNCFVNGHLTDNSCTKARMGYCDWNDADKSAAKHFG